MAKNRVSDNVGGVKHFLSARLHALREERHFALVDGVAFPSVGSLVIVFRSGTQSGPCTSSVATAIMITTSDSSLKRSGTPNQLAGDRLHTMAISGLSRVRTELFPLLVIPSLTHHPVQTNRLLAGHRDLWRFSVLAASSGEDTCCAIPARCVPSLALLPPSRNASSNCLVW